MLRWTEEQQREYEQRMGRSASSKSVPKKDVQPVTPIQQSLESAPAELTAKLRTQALGRLRTGTMNKTEARYAKHLKWRMHAG
ncbi:hypothetical protein NOM91_18580, partial [Proteus mirabilis]|nr:hypothetical protein [Proteus mirabilis]